MFVVPLGMSVFLIVKGVLMAGLRFLILLERQIATGVQAKPHPRVPVLLLVDVAFPLVVEVGLAQVLVQLLEQSKKDG